MGAADWIISFIYPEYSIVFGSDLVESSKRLQYKAVLRDWIQEESEEEHDYFSDSSQVAKNVQDSIDIPDVSNALRFKHDDCGVVCLIVRLYTELWSIDAMADLIELSRVTWPSKLQELVVTFDFMLSDEHVVLGDGTGVAEEICCTQTQNFLHGLATVLLLVNLLIHLPDVDLEIVYVLVNLLWRFAWLFIRYLLRFVIAPIYFKSNVKAIHGSSITV